MSGPFTTRQRAVLKDRLAKAIRWHKTPAHEREWDDQLAETQIRDMEATFNDAAAGRRAIVNLAEKLEKSA